MKRSKQVKKFSKNYYKTKKLDLSGCTLRKEDIKTLKECLIQSNCKLKKLDLSDTIISEELFSDLIDGLKGPVQLLRDEGEGGKYTFIERYIRKHYPIKVTINSTDSLLQQELEKLKTITLEVNNTQPDNNEIDIEAVLAFSDDGADHGLYTTGNISDAEEDFS